MIYYVQKVVDISESLWYYFIPWADFVSDLITLFFLWQWDENLDKRLLFWQDLKLEVRRKYFNSVFFCFCGNIYQERH